MIIKIYQINIDWDTEGHIFRSWDRVKDRFDFSIYELKWTGKVREGISLDGIFEIFNLDRPHDFKGHSMSVSDVVYYKGNYWYCDNIGWRNIG